MVQASTPAGEQLVRQVRELPALPEAVQRVLALLNKSESRVADIAHSMSLDPGLTGRVLRLVNSASFGFQRTIASVPHALAILGFNAIRSLVLSAGVMKAFGKVGRSGLDAKTFWGHSLSVAFLSRWLARRLRMSEAVQDEVFSAGMMHDIGKLILDIYASDDYARAIIDHKKSHGLISDAGPCIACEREQLQLDHSEIGAALAARWQLPERLQRCIREHHEPPVEPAGEDDRLVLLCALANQMEKPGKNWLEQQNACQWALNLGLARDAEGLKALAEAAVEEQQSYKDLIKQLVGSV